MHDEVDLKHLDQDQNPIPSSRHLLSALAELGFAAPNVPEQIHLVFNDQEDEMWVMFVTGDRAKIFVKYGLEEGSLDATVETGVARYEQSDMCDSSVNTSGWRYPGFIHDGVLEKRRKYYYRVGSDVGGWSSTCNFVPRDNDSNETIAFLFGDMGAWDSICNIPPLTRRE